MKTKMHHGASPGIFARARNLRKNPTRAEEILWSHLRNNQTGYKFRRQHPMDIYVVDFYCHFFKLVVFVDGGVHEDPETKEKDEEQLQFLTDQGIIVLRFSNEEVCFDISKVLDTIHMKFAEIKEGPSV